MASFEGIVQFIKWHWQPDLQTPDRLLQMTFLLLKFADALCEGLCDSWALPCC